MKPDDPSNTKLTYEDFQRILKDLREGKIKIDRDDENKCKIQCQRDKTIIKPKKGTS
jgi:hypothetical protein